MAMKKGIGFLLVNYRYFLLLVIILAAGSVIQDPVQNFINVLTLQAPFVFIYTCGMAIVMLTGGLDLSQGSVAALSSCLGAMVIIKDEIALGILIALGIGAFCGMANGIMITKAKMPPFIATYGMDWIVRGLAYIIMGGAMIYDFSDRFKYISEGKIFGLSNLIYIAALVFVVLFFLFQKTTFGRNVYMIGSNMKAAKLSGVRTGFVIMAVYMLSGILASIAGILYVSRLDCAEPFLGRGFGLLAISASLIGGTSLEGGKGGIANTVLGVLIMVFLTNALNVWKVSVLWQGAVFGVVIVIAALLEKVTNVYILRQIK
jgi:ribose transport system permease protein